MSSFHLPLLTPHPRSGSPTHLSQRRPGEERGLSQRQLRQHLPAQHASPGASFMAQLHPLPVPKALQTRGSQPPLTFLLNNRPSPQSGTPQRWYQKEATEKSYSFSREAQQEQGEPPDRSQTGVLSLLSCAVTHSRPTPGSLPVSSCRSPWATPAGHLSPQPWRLSGGQEDP